MLRSGQMFTGTANTMLRPDFTSTRATLLSLWDDGLTLREMAVALGVSNLTLTQMIDELIVAETANDTD